MILRLCDGPVDGRFGGIDDEPRMVGAERSVVPIENIQATRIHALEADAIMARGHPAAVQACPVRRGRPGWRRVTRPMVPTLRVTKLLSGNSPMRMARSR